VQAALADCQPSGARGPDADHKSCGLASHAAKGTADLPPPEPRAGIRRGSLRPCQIRARTSGKPRSPAGIHGYRERPLTWTRAGRPPRSSSARRQELRLSTTLSAGVGGASEDVVGLIEPSSQPWPGRGGSPARPSLKVLPNEHSGRHTATGSSRDKATGDTCVPVSQPTTPTPPPSSGGRFPNAMKSGFHHFPTC
jgi:hypothetical protein